MANSARSEQSVHQQGELPYSYTHTNTHTNLSGDLQVSLGKVHGLLMIAQCCVCIP